jgi:processive 1,2-diacylglycerol beta-glucosyltransferase
MIKLFDKESGVFLGAISEDQLNFLVDQLEEEGLEDRDYAITPMTLSLFEGEGADPVLLYTQAACDRQRLSLENDQG